MTLPVPPFAALLAKPEEVGPPKSIILYGEPGTRKTSLIGSMVKVPGMERGLIIDIDNGTETLVNDPIYKAAIADGRISIFPIDFTSPDAYGKLDYIINEVTTTDYGYDFVGLDTLDVGQEAMIAHLMATVLNDKGKLDPRAAWGEVSKKTSEWMWKFQNTPFFVGVTAMHSKEGAEDSGAYKVKPKLAGSVKDNIAGIPSLVAYLEFLPDENKVDHLVATLGKSSVFSTKNRYSIEGQITDFDMPALYKLISENQAALGAPAAPPVPAPLAAPPQVAPSTRTPIPANNPVAVAA